MPNTPDEVVALVTADPKPLICLDTCIYLDFIRNHLYPSYHKTLKALTNLIQQKSAYLLLPEIVVSEYNKNRAGVVVRASTTLEQMVDNVTIYQNIMTELGELPTSAYLPAHLTDKNSADTIFGSYFQRVDDLLRAGIELSLSAEVSYNAVQRAKNLRRPAKLDKPGYGDCLLVEAIIALAQKLRAMNFAAKVIFVSSNTNDFGDDRPTKRKFLHPDIEADFTPLSINFFAELAPVIFNPKVLA